MSNPLEIKVQNEIVDWLNEMRIPNWRISSANMSNFPDLLVLHKGKFVGLEIKRDSKAVVREGQLKKIRFIREHGGVADIVWSKEQVRDLLIYQDDVEELQEIYNYKGE